VFLFRKIALYIKTIFCEPAGVPHDITMLNALSFFRNQALRYHMATIFVNIFVGVCAINSIIYTI